MGDQFFCAVCGQESTVYAKGMCKPCYMRQYHAEHKKELTKYYRQYRDKHKEKIAEYQRRYRAKHPDKVHEQVRLWQITNPDKVAQYNQRYRAHKANADINDFTAADWQVVLTYHDNRCAYCGQDNLSLTQDHVIPLSRGGNHTISNIVPACQVCNSRKGARTPIEANMYPAQPTYGYKTAMQLLGAWQTIKKERKAFEELGIINAKDFDAWVRRLEENRDAIVTENPEYERMAEKFNMLIVQLRKEQRAYQDKGAVK